MYLYLDRRCEGRVILIKERQELLIYCVDYVY